LSKDDESLLRQLAAQRDEQVADAADRSVMGKLRSVFQ